jgi:hypothetical protein
MSAERSIKKVKLAISKAQQAAGQIPPDLASRVTALESAYQGFDTRMDAVESLIVSGFTGTVSLITSVDFTAQTSVSKTLTFNQGVLTGAV